MLKKFLLLAVLMSAPLCAEEQPFCLVKKMPQGELPKIMPVQGLAGRFGAWLLSGDNTPAKQAVTGLLIWCVAYTLYQSAKSIGTTAWSLWHGGVQQLEPNVKREVDREVIRLLQEYERLQVAARNNDRMLNAAYLKQKSEQKNEQPIVQSSVHYEDYDEQQAPAPKVAHAQNDATCVCGTCRKRSAHA